VDGDVELKVKGMAMYDGKVQDATDLVHPSKEKDALFITTRFLDTPQQHRGTCRSSYKKDVCATAADCPKGSTSKSQIGTYTGVCQAGGCVVTSWCPTENKAIESRAMPEVENFTIFARASVRFYDGQTTSNLINESGHTSLKLLKGKDLFAVRDILRMADSKYGDVAKMGGAFSMQFGWDCNLDFGARQCHPKVGVERLDDPNSTFSSGSNFRYAYYWKSENGTNYRYLRKAYGIRVLFSNTGIGRGFDGVTAVIVLASALALLKIATAVADFLAVQCLPKKLWYQSVIFKHAFEDDAEHEALIKIGADGEKANSYGSGVSS
jgi:P2X purinoceptor 3